MSVLPRPVIDLPNNGIKVLLMRRTGNDNVRVAVGYRDAFGQLRGWHAARPPTHYCDLPTFASKAVKP